MTDQPSYPPPPEQPSYTPPPAYSNAPAYQAPPSYPAPAYGGGAVDTYPGKSLGIAALVCSCIFFVGLAVIAGLVMGIIARNQSKAVGRQNTPAKAAIIVSSVLIGLYVVLIVLLIVIGGIAAASCSGGYCS